jgi:hypothetical protein
LTNPTNNITPWSAPFSFPTRHPTTKIPHPPFPQTEPFLYNETLKRTDKKELIEIEKEIIVI